MWSTSTPIVWRTLLCAAVCVASVIGGCGRSSITTVVLGHGIIIALIQTGHRLTCSPTLDDATDFIVKTLQASNFDNVHTEPVPNLPKWTRGNADVRLTGKSVQKVTNTARGFYAAPWTHQMNVLALGGSQGGSVQGEAIVVRNFTELEYFGQRGLVQCEY